MDNYSMNCSLFSFSYDTVVYQYMQTVAIYIIYPNYKAIK